LALLVALALAVRRQWLLLAGWAAAMAGAGVLDAVLKHIVQRPRPPQAATFLHRDSFSFPSGHAMISLVAYGMLAYLLVLFWGSRRGRRVAIIAVAAALALAIGFSRLYLGVHYFSDVIGGYAGGLLWLSACVTALEIARRHPESRLSGDPPAG
ncbi:MAG: phosphatase PAP2 family protein, partial [Acidobacteriota bacterium]|nr:phosphatase PAP2 family protein [Acidobacteriota bacterium]